MRDDRLARYMAARVRAHAGVLHERDGRTYLVRARHDRDSGELIVEEIDLAAEAARAAARFAAYGRAAPVDRSTIVPTAKDHIQMKIAISARERSAVPTKNMPDERAVFNRWVRGGFDSLTADDWTVVRNTMSTTTGSEGGYAVPSPVAGSIFDLMKAYSPVRYLATPVRTTTGVAIPVPTSDGTTEVGELLAQNVTATAADPSFGTAALTPYRFSSKTVTVPWELLQDAQADLEPWIDRRLAQRIARASNAYFTTGTGTNQPFGFVTRATVGKTGTTGQTLTIIYDDLVDLMTSVDAAYRASPRCAWQCSDAMLKVMLKVKDSAGQPVIEAEPDAVIRALERATLPSDEAIMLDDNAPATPFSLLGYPLFVNNDMASPAANAKTLAFGDWSAYRVRDVVAPNLTSLLRFTDSAYVLKGQVGFLMMARSGGNLLDPNAIKVYQHSAT